MTSAEHKAASIAKAIVKALVRLEADTMNDIELTIDDMRMYARHESTGVKDAVEVLANHYVKD